MRNSETAAAAYLDAARAINAAAAAAAAFEAAADRYCAALDTRDARFNAAALIMGEDS
tara:strand:+ start:244 stop:417 length:174 start_codon:yes stop_codon:yes gene_type:complete